MKKPAGASSSRENKVNGERVEQAFRPAVKVPRKFRLSH